MKSKIKIKIKCNNIKFAVDVFFDHRGKTHAVCLLRWGKTYVAFLLHFVACAMACLGSSHFVVFLYSRSLGYLDSPIAKNNFKPTKLGHVPDPSLSTVADDPWQPSKLCLIYFVHSCKKLQ